MKQIYFLLMLLIFSSAEAQEIREFMDSQMHPTMHVPYPFFGKGFKTFASRKEPRRTFKHQFKNVNYANYWKNNKGARIIVTGALTKETIRNKAMYRTKN